MSSSASSVATQRRVSLLKLLKLAANSGARFAPVSAIDDAVSARQASVFLKHDIHYVEPARLLDLARAEAAFGVFGTYFFMDFEHPIGARHFSRSEQTTMMSELKSIGHEIGLHFDPLFEVIQRKGNLRTSFRKQIDSFSEIVGAVTVANLHGNSGLKIKDRNGNNLVYDFFEELARQPDFPDLAAVDARITALLKENRVSLLDLDIGHWGDSWLWSRSLGTVATNLISDNWVGKRESFSVTSMGPNTSAYGVNPRLTAGVINADCEANWQFCDAPRHLFQLSQDAELTLDSQEATAVFDNSLRLAPCVMLLHPQFYCV